MSDSALRGLTLFNSEKMECFHCHSGFNFQDSLIHEGKPFRETRFHNTGALQHGRTRRVPGAEHRVCMGDGTSPQTWDASACRRCAIRADRALHARREHRHLERSARSLRCRRRNVPADRTPETEARARSRSGLMVGFTLSDQERADVLAFFDSLTDHGLLSDPRFADPWPCAFGEGSWLPRRCAPRRINAAFRAVGLLAVVVPQYAGQGERPELLLNYFPERLDRFARPRWPSTSEPGPDEQRPRAR